MHRRWRQHSRNPEAVLLLCPNLTVVALGAAAIIGVREVSNENASWLLLTDFVMTVAAVALLPSSPAAKPVAVGEPSAEPNQGHG